MNRSDLKPAYAALIISLFAIGTFLALVLLRFLDDNRLTSWKWVFTPDRLIVYFPLLIAGLGLAYILSQFVSLKQNPIFLFLFSFFTAALFWQVPEVIVDAARYFTQAKHLKMYGIGYFLQQWGKDISAWTDMPLVPFLYGLVFRIFGEHRIAIQIFTTLLFSMTVVLTYLIGSLLWDEDTGMIGGLLLMGIPYLFSQVPLMLVDVPTLFLLTFTIFAVIKALQQGSLKWMGIAAVAVFLVFYAKFSTWLWLSVIIPICAVYLKIDPRTTARRMGVIGGLSLIIIGAVILVYYDVLSEQLRFLISYQKPGLKRWGESFISTFFFQIHPFSTLFALFSIYVALRKKDLKYGIICYLVFLVIFMQIRRIRYIVPLFPMFTLMAAYGLMQIKNSETRRFIVFGIIFSSLFLAYFAYLPFLQTINTVNLKQSGKFVNSLDAENIEVFTLPQQKSIINPAISVPLFDIFTSKRVIYDADIDAAGMPDKIKKSALRFTWEYKNPPYYSEDNAGFGKIGAVVVISSDPGQRLPASIAQKTKKYSRSRVFNTVSNLFRYRTVVTVYYN